eukprot:3364940-Pleurochrysis_carterae.AAC.1
MRVRVDRRRGVVEARPELRLGGRERVVGDARLCELARLDVVPAEEATGEQVERRRQRARREEGAARVDRVAEVARGAGLREPLAVA